jgi:heme oxygenase
MTAGHGSAMSFVQMLRSETAADHMMVDERFGGFALDDAGDYRAFLEAHGRALPAVEAALTGRARGGDAAVAWPAWRVRTPLIAADLAALGAALPPPLPFALTGDAAHWGALYVIEGSRLGGQLLARSVPDGLSRAYLSARHLPGEWRGLLAALDAAAAAQDAGWREAALAGARATFALYAQAAADRAR